jgi:hypothetical protein
MSAAFEPQETFEVFGAKAAMQRFQTLPEGNQQAAVVLWNSALRIQSVI